MNKKVVHRNKLLIILLGRLGTIQVQCSRFWSFFWFGRFEVQKMNQKFGKFDVRFRIHNFSVQTSVRILGRFASEVQCLVCPMLLLWIVV